MDPITVEDIYKKKELKRFRLYRNNLSPQTTDREVAAMILTPSILKFL
jgi:hypothetical protein